MDHHDEVEPEDLLKLYSSFACDFAGEGERT